MKSGGEVVQVKGGHILRPTGRKDRHSKVYTSKGPRDRRVRLSAHTAIQFYDVQDRLGYDRPSKAVDWLIRKAKSAIDKLSELPPWQPPNEPSTDSNPSSNDLALDHQSAAFIHGNSSNHNHNPGSSSNSSFMPDDTMKSFFPTGSFSSFPGFANGAVPRAEDLGLSLHSENTNYGNLFHECYQRIDGWSGGGDARVGLVMNSQQAMFSQGLPFHHRELLQSNLGDLSWNQTAMDQQSVDFGSPLERGFTIPARIHREEEPDSHV